MADAIGSVYIGLGIDSRDFDSSVPVIGRMADDLGARVKRGFMSGSGAVDRFTVSAGASRAAAQNLGFQLNDIATSLASGGSPFRILAQQAGQVQQAFQQGGGVLPTLKAFGSSLRGVVTPTTAVVAGVAAVAAGIGFLTERAIASTNATREFGVMLKGLAGSGGTTAAGLEDAAKRLRDVGLTADQARTALTAATRAGINPAQAERVVRTGQNLIPVLGPDAPQAFVSAITGGVEPLGKLGLQLGVVTEKEVAAARQAAEFGQQIKFLDEWFGRIEQKVKGFNNDALSPVGRAMRELNQNTADLLDTMSKSKGIALLIDGLNNLAIAMKQLFELKPPAWMTSLMGAVTPGVGALGGWIAGKLNLGSSGGPVATAPIPPIGSGGSLTKEQTLDLIERYESNGRNIFQQTGARDSTAQGNFQITNSTWQTVPASIRQGYPNAMAAPYAVQRAAAGYLYDTRGTQPWTGTDPRTGLPFNPKLAAALSAGGMSGGSVLARPGEPLGEYAGQREVEFARIGRETDAERALDRMIASAYASGGVRGGSRAEIRAQADIETDRRFGFGTLTQDQERQREEQASQRRRQLIGAGQDRGARTFAEQNAQDTQRVETLKLETSLMGASTEEIQRQVDLLKVKQDAEKVGLDLNSQEVQARLKSVNALSDANVQLAKQRELWGEIQEVGNVFQNTFSSVFDSIFQGSFKLSNTLKSLAQDLIKTFANQAFRNLLTGGAGSSTGGILGGLFSGGLSFFGLSSASGGGGGGGAKFASGGSFMVGGSGGIDSQLVQFNATPGEMVNISHGNDNAPGYGGINEVHVILHPNDSFITDIANRQIGAAAPAIVKQAVGTTQRNFNGMAAQAQARG